jgi:DNA-binding response OmpR family regulator
VVEPDPDVREALVAVLTFGGYEAFPFSNGASALRAVTEIRPGLILLDLTPPNGDATSFVHELGRRGVRRVLPLIVLSADSTARDRADEVGAEGYLDKPFQVRDLLAKVATVLRGAS